MRFLEFLDGELHREFHADESLSSSRGVRVVDRVFGEADAPRRSVSRLLNRVVEPFLPRGYPDSVTPDYAFFQIWDTCQALCSYVRGMLCQKAMMVGIGVGSEAATPLGALFSFFMRDFIGMLGGIVFAYFQGSGLDSHAKQWRLFADCVNNVGLALELASPLLPRHFLLMACLGSIARSLCGVAAGATRAAMTQHFALKRNAADISAKEGSQETATTLAGMAIGLAITRVVSDNPTYAWSTFLVLTVLHIYCNVRAVRSLCHYSLNCPRLDVLLQEYLASGEVLTPLEVAGKEPLLIPAFHRLQKRMQAQSIVDIQMGTPLSQLMQSSSPYTRQSLVAASLEPATTQRALHLIHREGRQMKVVLHRRVDTEGLLLAYIHATVARHICNKGCTQQAVGAQKDRAWMEESDEWMDNHSTQFVQQLGACGWDVAQVAVSTDSWRAEWPAAQSALKQHAQ